MQDSKKAHKLNSLSEEDTYNFAKDILNELDSSTRLILLKGKLGAGKTTFVKGFAKALGADINVVKSPTYTYMRTYKGLNKEILHVDLYRLETLNVQLLEEIQEYIEKDNNYVLIEWPEVIENYLPLDRQELNIEHGKEPNSRILSLKNAN